MPYPHPTLTELRAQAMQDISSSDIGADGFLKKAVLRVLAWVMAAFAYLHYQFLDYIARQAVPWSATDEYALGWGALVGVTPADAGFAAGTALFTNSAIGTPVFAGSTVTRLDGFTYLSTAEAIVAGDGTLALPIQATLAGSAGNADSGTTLVLANAVEGINSSGTASGPLTGGTDQEAQDAFKARYLERYANPPQGGDRADYITWSLAVPGITRAWVDPNGNGPGTVIVYTMLDIAEAAHGGFPQGTGGGATNEARMLPATGDQLTVANAIYALQPVTALVDSEAPIAAPVAFTITNLGANNTTAMHTAIEAALADMFLRLANVGGTVNPADGSAWPAIDPSQWYAALAAIPGLTLFDITVPSAPITPGAGQLFTVGACTFAA